MEQKGKIFVISNTYTSVAVPFTEEIEKALPILISAFEVTHESGNTYTKSVSHPNTTFSIGELNGNY